VNRITHAVIGGAPVSLVLAPAAHAAIITVPVVTTSSS
jgi:hypothetical protein